MRLSVRPRIGITLGDPSGIGPEVVAKALGSPAIKQLAHFTVIGQAGLLQNYGLTPGKQLTIISPGEEPPRKIKPGKSTLACARASLDYLKCAVQLLKDKKITALVTAPVCKEAINRSGVRFYGHTEFLAAAFGVKDFEMMFVAPRMRAIIATRHIALPKVKPALSSAGIFQTIQLAHRTLQKTFRIANPRIAVCGLNPHAGEGGTIGREEDQIIIPAIRRARRQGMRVTGPLAADTLFWPPHAKNYDVIIAMYHDQGLTPIKALYFNQLVNLTIGLPFIRTSPAHGTAFDIAGKGKADPASMVAAIQLAARLSRHSS